MLKNKSMSNSKRYNLGKLELISRRCPHCGHNKAFKNVNSIKCTRCRTVLYDPRRDAK